jgi:dolichyl-phosphate beta-glucosyltransferase
MPQLREYYRTVLLHDWAVILDSATGQVRAVRMGCNSRESSHATDGVSRKVAESMITAHGWGSKSSWGLVVPVRISVVIPAYQESGRLPQYLHLMRPYLDAVFPVGYEVIVVDDGSTDELARAVRGHCGPWPQLAVLRHRRNLGKGAALRTGVCAASAPLVLVADADGATPIQEEKPLRQAIERGAAIAVGSRLLGGGGAEVERVYLRQVCGRLFSLLVRWLFRLPIRDTQCGFKMFRREVALTLFPHCRESGYLLDLEILAWADCFGYAISEVAVSWRDVPGSKVRLLRDGWTMLRGLLRLRRSLPRAARDCPSCGPAPDSLVTGSPPPTRQNRCSRLLPSD